MLQFINYEGHPLLADFARHYKHLEAAIAEANLAVRHRKKTYGELISWEQVKQAKARIPASNSTLSPTVVEGLRAKHQDLLAKYHDRQESDAVASYRFEAARQSLYMSMCAFSRLALRTLDFHLIDEGEPEINKTFDPFASRDRHVYFGTASHPNEPVLDKNTPKAKFQPYERHVGLVNLACGVELYKEAVRVYDSMNTNNRYPSANGECAESAGRQASTFIRTVPALRVRHADEPSLVASSDGENAVYAAYHEFIKAPFTF